jgi:Tfp pilus assembly protein PilF
MQLAEGSGAMFEFEMRSVLAHAQLAVGRLAPARATAEGALTDIAHVAELRDAVERSTAPGLCRVWWALASAHLGRPADAETALRALLAEENEGALQALYGTHAFLCEVLRLRGDVPGALAQGRRAVEVAEERGSVFSRVEAAAFFAAAQLESGDVAEATNGLERALALARDRRTALWYEPRMLATLVDAKLAAGDRSAARALLSEARELVDRGRGWRLGAFDVALARARFLASEPAADHAAIASALDSLDGIAAELGSEPYRLIAALERARLVA